MDTNETRIYNLFLISVSLLLAILVYYLLNLIRVQAIHRKQFLHSLGRQALMLENNRRRISENLHDELAPMVTAAKMHMGAVVNISGTNSGNLEQATPLLDKLQIAMRSISSILIPSVLEKKGFVEAIKEYAFNLEAPSFPLITIHAEEIPTIPYFRSVLIYRIMQEIIHNTCKHANASRLQISLRHNKKQIIIATIDDGIGFNYHANIKASKGVGLTSMISKIHLLGGSLRVDGKAGITGTRYFITIPLTDNSPQISETHDHFNYPH